MQKPNVEAIYPLSPLQQGMLFHSLYQPDSGEYIHQFHFRLGGDLDLTAFRQACERLVARHGVLRTAFAWENRKEPLQIVQRQVKLPWTEEDISSLNEEEREQRVARFIKEDGARGFALNKAPLTRLSFFRHDPNTVDMVWTTHHILMDGWCQGVLFKEMIALYHMAQKGLTHDLPQPRPYKDYISWLKQQELAKAEVFWRDWLGNFHEPTPPPAAREVDGVKSGHIQNHIFTLSAETTATLDRLARGWGLTLSSICQAATGLLLCRYTASEDVVFGSVVAGRPTDLAGAQEMIGLFINTLPVRVTIDRQTQLSDWLKKLQERLAEMRRFEYSPLTDIQRWSGVPRGKSLFESLITFQNQPSSDEEEAPNLNVTQMDVVEYTNYPFAILFGPGKQLSIQLQYDDQRLDAARIEHLAEWLKELFEQIARDPHRSVNQFLNLISKRDQQLIEQTNATTATLSEPLLFHQRFAARAVANPEAPALIHGEQVIDYQTLHARSDFLSSQLLQRGVRTGTVVGVYLNRGPAVAIAFLAILKAGGVYLPLDPTNPEDRLAYILSDSRASLIIAGEGPTAPFPSFDLDVIQIDPDGDIPATNGSALPQNHSPEQAAYLIYTSGSTGKPKGALLHHRGYCNLVQEQIGLFDAGSNSRILQFAALSFDASLWEMAMALGTGGALVTANATDLMPGPDLAKTLIDQQITHLTLPPSALANLPREDYQDLAVLVVAGEACSPHLVEQWSQGRRFFNAYGPTETTVCATIYPCETPGKPTIGKPLANFSAHVMDSNGQPSPVAAQGELVIGGVALSSGYYHRPALTAERFIPNPYDQQPGGRLYRSGDLVWRQPDGDLDFLGRIDHQVKLRGFRIELGEIEAALSARDDVREAAVLVLGEKLVAFLNGETAARPESDLLKKHLAASLPEYMVPSNFIWLADMPLSPAGKIDRHALAAIDLEDMEERPPYQGPRNKREEIIAGIWEEIFEKDRVGIHENFYDLGGHSLLAVRLITKVTEIFPVKIPLRVFLEQPTIADFARIIGENRDQAPSFSDIDLGQEVRLDASIQPTKPLEQREPQAILLTGATGFVGGFLLDSLLKRTRARFYCLVRAADAARAKQRLERHMQRLQLPFDDRIIAIPGDLSRKRLGLPAKRFAELTREIDLIIHNGAQVNFLLPYTHLKNANVSGTEWLLRMACEHHTKPFHYVSTLSVFPPEAYADQTISEDEPLVEWRGLGIGYAQSKWVAERIVLLARERGLPTAIYRLGLVGGHAATGVSNESDLIWRMVKAFLQNRSAPKGMERKIDFQPVDYVAEAIATIVLNPTSHGKAFHFSQTQSITLETLLEWATDMGYKMARIPRDAWRHQILQLEQNESNPLAPLLPVLFPEDGPSQPSKIRLPRFRKAKQPPEFDQQNTHQALADTGIVCPGVDRALIDTYFRYLNRIGFLPNPEGNLRRTT